MPQLIENPPEIKIHFHEERILVRLGVNTKALDPEAKTATVKTIIREEMARSLRLIKPRLVAALLDSEELPDDPVFQGAEKAALCLCTIGKDMESQCQEAMSKGELLRGLILDGLGSEAVTGVVKQAEAWLAGAGRDLGFRPSKLFAPGYAGWSLGGQRFIFQVLPAAEIGVSLSDSLMMSPRKSYSFRINYYGEKRP